MPTHDLSVIVPVLNGERHIKECLASLDAVRDVNTEVIVVDGGSSDGTAELIKSAGSLVTRSISEPDQGQADAINKGFALASAPFVAWLCADDSVEPDAYAHGISILRESSTCAVTFGDILVCGESGVDLHISRFPPSFSIDGLLSYQSVSQPGSIYRRSAVEETGGVRSDLHFVMDLELYLRLHAAGHTSRHIGAVAARFRISDESKSGNQPDAFVRESARVLREYGRAGSRGVRRAKRKMLELALMARLRSSVPARALHGLLNGPLSRFGSDSLRGSLLGLCVGRHFGNLRAGPGISVSNAEHIVLGHGVSVEPGAQLMGPLEVAMQTVVRAP